MEGVTLGDARTGAHWELPQCAGSIQQKDESGADVESEESLQIRASLRGGPGQIQWVLYWNRGRTSDFIEKMGQMF